MNECGICSPGDCNIIRTDSAEKYGIDGWGVDCGGDMMTRSNGPVEGYNQSMGEMEMMKQLPGSFFLNSGIVYCSGLPQCS